MIQLDEGQKCSAREKARDEIATRLATISYEADPEMTHREAIKVATQYVKQINRILPKIGYDPVPSILVYSAEGIASVDEEGEVTY